jgi:hypothetical protein
MSSGVHSISQQPSELSNDERMQQAIDRIIERLHRENPSSSYDDNLTRAEIIYERQETMRIRMEGERIRASNAALSSLPVPTTGQTVTATQIGMKLNQSITYMHIHTIILCCLNESNALIRFYLDLYLANVVSHNTTIHMNEPVPPSE